MSSNTSDRLTKALNLRRAIAEDGQDITPEQAREELIAQGKDPSEVAAAGRTMVMELLATARKRTLHAAQARVASRKASDAVVQRDVSAVRRALAKLAAQPASVAGKRIAVAHRNGTGQSDSDALSLWQDLVDLGAVTDDDLAD